MEKTYKVTFTVTIDNPPKDVKSYLESLVEESCINSICESEDFNCVGVSEIKIFFNRMIT